MRATLVSIVLAGTACVAGAQAGSPATARRRGPAMSPLLAPGPFAVGVSVALVRDSSRTLASSGTRRPVQVTVWYPSGALGRAPLTYGDYFDLAAAELDTLPDAAATQRNRAGFQRFLREHGVPDSVFAAWFGAPMLATRDAPPAGGRYPVVLVAQGNDQSAHDQAALAEYVASHGYVVATSPSHTRVSGQPKSADDIGASAEEQADDLAFVLARVARRADADTARVGVVAHSFGARGALLFAMRGAPVDALVSLDGGIGTATGRESMERAPSFDARRVRAPILHMYERLDNFMRPDFALLSKLGAPVWLVRAPDMHHHHFTTLGAAGGTFPALARATGATPATAAAYGAMAGVSLAFLDSYVKGDATAFAAARAAAGRPGPGVPALVFTELRAARGEVP